jgi:acyl-CoA synthetase (AMP-forming)/AMP-acid ligase II
MNEIAWYDPPRLQRARVLLGGRRHWTYASFLDRLVDLYGPRTSFLLDEPITYPGFTGSMLTYDDVGRIVNRIAGALRALGVARGDRVGLITMNRVELVFCNFAAARLGAIPVPMNFMLTPTEVEHIVQRAGIELVVTDPSILGGTIPEPAAVPSVKRWVMVAADGAPPGVTLLADAMADAPERVEPVEPDDEHDTALLFFTSGTTGFPKGAMLSHAAATIGLRTHGAQSGLDLRRQRRLNLLVMPVAHAAGYAQIMLNLGMGIVQRLLSRFDVEAIFREVEQTKPTVFSGSPAMYRMLLEAGAHEHDWSSVKVFGGGADVFDDELVTAVRDLGARRTASGRRKRPWFLRGYGMAEANSYVSMTPPFRSGDACCGWVQRPVTYRLIDEDGNDVPRGEPGELVLKGPNITKGYWNDPEATAEAFTPDGWFRTGDVLRTGKWRMLYFVGRSGEIIKSGGYKISATEIDQVLMQHPDVDASATVGLPHPLKGERPFSAVVLRAGCDTTTEDVLAWARDKIARYKCPRAIVAIDAIPMTFSMKPKRLAVRERLLRELPAEVREA